MICHEPIRNILRPGGPYTGSFIQCVNGKDSQIPKLCCWDIYGICREVHLKVSVKIPAGKFGEFVVDELSENWWRNHIIGEFLINGSVQFIGLSQI